MQAATVAEQLDILTGSMTLPKDETDFDNDRDDRDRNSSESNNCTSAIVPFDFEGNCNSEVVWILILIHLSHIIPPFRPDAEWRFEGRMMGLNVQ